MMRKNKIAAVLIACLGTSIVWVSRVAIADEDFSPPEMTLEMFRSNVENIAPPICFLAKDLDVNGDGVITEADAKAAKELKEHDPFFVKFDAKLRDTWPECDGDRSWKSYKGPMTNAAVKRLIEILVTGVVPRPGPKGIGGDTREFVGVVLTKWNGFEHGRCLSIPLSTQTLEDLQTQRVVLIFDFKSKSWKPKLSEPVKYFGSAPRANTT